MQLAGYIHDCMHLTSELVTLIATQNHPIFCLITSNCLKNLNNHSAIYWLGLKFVFLFGGFLEKQFATSRISKSRELYKEIKK